MRRAQLAGQFLEATRVATLRERGHGSLREAEGGRPAVEAGPDLAQRIGGEDGGQPRLGVAVGGVLVAHGLGRLEGARHVGEVEEGDLLGPFTFLEVAAGGVEGGSRLLEFAVHAGFLGIITLRRK